MGCGVGDIRQRFQRGLRGLLHAWLARRFQASGFAEGMTQTVHSLRSLSGCMDGNGSALTLPECPKHALTNSYRMGIGTAQRLWPSSSKIP